MQRGKLVSWVMLLMLISSTLVKAKCVREKAEGSSRTVRRLVSNLAVLVIGPPGHYKSTLVNLLSNQVCLPQTNDLKGINVGTDAMVKPISTCGKSVSAACSEVVTVQMPQTCEFYLIDIPGLEAVGTWGAEEQVQRLESFLTMIPVEIGHIVWILDAKRNLIDVDRPILDFVDKLDKQLLGSKKVPITLFFNAAHRDSDEANRQLLQLVLTDEIRTKQSELFLSTLESLKTLNYPSNQISTVFGSIAYDSDPSVPDFRAAFERQAAIQQIWTLIKGSVSTEKRSGSVSIHQAITTLNKFAESLPNLVVTSAKAIFSDPKSTWEDSTADSLIRWNTIPDFLPCSTPLDGVVAQCKGLSQRFYEIFSIDVFDQFDKIAQLFDDLGAVDLAVVLKHSTLSQMGGCRCQEKNCSPTLFSST